MELVKDVIETMSFVMNNSEDSRKTNKGTRNKLKAHENSQFNTKETTIKNNNVSKANLILDYVSFGIVPNDYEKKVFLKKELNIYKDRVSQLLRIIDIIPEPTMSNELEVTGKAYYLLGAKYRLKALEVYIIKNREHGLDNEESVILADILEKEYFFKEATYMYLKLIKINPSFPGYYSSLSRVLTKMHKIDLSLKVLEMAQNTSYYEPYRCEYQPSGYNSDFKFVIDNALEETKKKKDRGYVYKPRKRKTI